MSTDPPDAYCLDLYSLILSMKMKLLYRIDFFIKCHALTPMSLCKWTDNTKGMTEDTWRGSEEQWCFYYLHSVPSSQNHCSCPGSPHPPTCWGNALWATTSVCRFSWDRKHLGNNQLEFFHWGILKRGIRNNTRCTLLPKFEKMRKTQWTNTSYTGLVSTPTREL